jgi:hypothetical protein
MCQSEDFMGPYAYDDWYTPHLMFDHGLDM